VIIRKLSNRKEEVKIYLNIDDIDEKKENKIINVNI
jgi:hypothetical protein